MVGPSGIDPRALLAHAVALARSDDAAPDDARLRRAVSAAYYAVFHAVALAVAAHLVPASRDETRYRLARSVHHRRVADVCTWLTRGGAKQHVAEVVARLRRAPDVVGLAQSFVDLQDARHVADYDHLSRIDASAAESACADAGRALALLDELRGTPDLDELLALVALNTALR